MTSEAKTALLGAIERRLTEISAQQHALAVEEARLLEHLTPLRLGIVAPDTAVVQLKAKRGHAPRTDGGEVGRPTSAARGSEGGGLPSPRGIPRSMIGSRMTIEAKGPAHGGCPRSRGWVRRYVFGSLVGDVEVWPRAR